MTYRFCIALFAISGCAAPPPGTLRFNNQAPHLEVNDRLDIKKPKTREFVHFRHLNDAYLLRRLPRTMAVRAQRRAEAVNSMDEAPSSTWFTNRIGVRDMSVEEVRRGPNRGINADEAFPWEVRSTKVGGASIGFIIEDSLGRKFILKFDENSYPEIETAADIVVQRLLWASGYYTPEDSIVYFRPEDIVVNEKSVAVAKTGKKRPMTRADFDQALSKVQVDPDGRIRGLVSRFVNGIPVGGYPFEGTRGDDINDRVPHENRRDVRGQAGFFSWLEHTDLRENNTLDAWEEDPKDPSKHYLVHYLIDFGKALGTMGYIESRRQIGHVYATDIKHVLMTLPTLGLWKRPWEDRRSPDYRGVGIFDSKTYRPGDFQTNLPYFPFSDADRFDYFWAAKIIARFSPEQIRAAVEEARLSDPRATDYLTKILVERQQISAKYWFARVNPLDGIRLEMTESGTKLCMEDLVRTYHLHDESVAASTYSTKSFDHGGRRIAPQSQLAPVRGAKGTICLDLTSLGSEHNGYTIIRISTRRGSKSLPPLDVHLAREPESAEVRVIGIRRH